MDRHQAASSTTTPTSTSTSTSTHAVTLPSHHQVATPSNEGASWLVSTDFLIDAVAGVAGGVIGVWVGSPLDVIKTRLQASAASSSSASASASGTSSSPSSSSSPPLRRRPPTIWQAIRTTVREEGFRALFRGSMVASLSQAPNNFIAFGAYGFALDALITRRRAAAGAAASAAGSTASSSSSSSSSTATSMTNSATTTSSSSNTNTTSGSGRSGGDLTPTYGEYYWAGAAAGFLQSLALTPFELIKVQQQVYHAVGVATTARVMVTTPSSPPSSSSAHNGGSNRNKLLLPQQSQSSPSSSSSLSMTQCARNIIKARGLRGLFGGLSATFLRDAPTYGLYFVSFEWTKRTLMEMMRMMDNNDNTHTTTTLEQQSLSSSSSPTTTTTPTPPPWGIVLVSGAVAGCLSWAFAIPADVIKSVVQAAPLETKAIGLRQATRAVYYSSGLGWRGFFVGAAPLMLRAAPVNAVTFLGYELATIELRGNAQK